MNANCFKEDLAWSEEQRHADWWTPYYRKAFPFSIRIESVPGPSDAQRAGVDKFVVFKGGKRIAVDEKVRRHRRPSDILIEFRHVPTNGGEPWPGWVEKENQFTDFIAMGFVVYRLAFFLPFQTLVAAWFDNKAEWLARFGTLEAPNPRVEPRYMTQFCPVPTEVLLGHLLCAMRIQL